MLGLTYQQHLYRDRRLDGYMPRLPGQLVMIYSGIALVTSELDVATPRLIMQVVTGHRGSAIAHDTPRSRNGVWGNLSAADAVPSL